MLTLAHGISPRGPFPVGGGEMGELIRSTDWSKTPIGAVEGWSPALRMVVDLMMVNRFPMILWWGPRFTQLYNDPYRPIPGDKHPRSLGQPADECWAEIWHVIGPLIETPFRGGPATWMEDIQLEIRRHGFLEETHFTIAYSPVPDDTVESGIGGVLATVHEITGKVVGDRRVVALRDLGARSAEARTAEEACAVACQTLARHPKDVPFALLYLLDSDGREARLAGTAGVEPGHPSCPATLSLEATAAPWPLAEALRTGTLQSVEDLRARLSGQVPRGPWQDPPQTAAVVPIRSSQESHLAGFLVVGVSARLQLDEPYRDFLHLVASQVATGITRAREYEEEKRRAEALAAFDALLKELRADPVLKALPVVVHSARAGGEARIEGRGAGVDDDLSKPFSARELLARVAAQVELAQVRQEAAEALRESEGRFRTVIESSCDAINVLDVKTHRYVFFSPAHVAMTGFSEDELLRMTPDDAFERVHPDDRAAAVGQLAALARGENAPTAEYRWKTKSGDYRWISDRRALIRNAAGEIVSLVGVFRGIDEQKRGEQALRRALAEAEEGRRILEAMMESIPEGIAITGGPPGFPLVKASRAGLAMAGGARPELTGIPSGDHQTAWDLVRPDGSRPRPEEMPLFRASRLGEDVRNVELALRQPDGTTIPVLVDAAPIRNGAGEVVGAVNCWRDISELKRAQDAIRESEARQVLLLMFSDALRLLRDSGEMQALACRILGEHFGAERVYYAEFDWERRRSRVRAEYAQAGARSMVGDDPIAEQTETLAALARGRSVFVADVREAADVSEGTRRFCEAEGIRAFGSVPLVKEGHLVWSLNLACSRPRVWSDQDVALVADVAERTWTAVERGRAEEELRRSQAQLEEADRRKNHFLAVLSHELRNPLTPVKNSLYILDRVPPGSEQARRSLKVIGRQVDQLAHLVDELLDVTRITRSKIQLQRRRLELSAVVRRTVDDHRGLFERSQIELSMRASPDLLFVDADPNRVAQIVGNLLLNAAKFTPAGGRVEVEVAPAGEAQAALVHVRDSGVGLDASMLGRLFEPFMQADSSLDRSKGGLGLGLALVKGLVELHGGTVEARSPGPGQGSEFTVRLPLAGPVAEDAVAPAPAPAQPAGGRRRVMIIEDNPDAAESLRQVLELCGHEVAVAGDGGQGLARAREFRPELVLCDIGLPGMDGYAVARAFRADAALQGVRLVALSGYAQPEDMERAAEAGFEKHLAKPPSLEKLQSVLGGPPESSTSGR